MRRIRHVASRYTTLFLAVGLVAFGAWSLLTLQRGTQDATATANTQLARLAADEVRLSLEGSVRVFGALASELSEHREASERDRLLRAASARFPMFRALALVDANGVAVASSQPTRSTTSTARAPTNTHDGVGVSAVFVGSDGLPAFELSASVHTPDGLLQLTGELGLSETQRIIERIQVGSRGYALLVDASSRLVSHGNPAWREPARRAGTVAGNPLVGRATAGDRTDASPGGAHWRLYTDSRGVEQLGVAASIPDFGFTLIVEQPTDEVLAPTDRLARQLVYAALAAAGITLVVGLLIGGSSVGRVDQVRNATQALAAGNFDARVHLGGGDEVAELARSFNSMADRLTALQENIKSQERQLTFGRVVAGLFHDLNHPIQNIANNARLLMREDLDAEGRAAVQQTIEHEYATLQRIMDDVLNVARPRPVDRSPIDVRATVAEVVEAMRAEADRSHVSLSAVYAPQSLTVSGDRFALGRVYRNLIANAIQATAPGGRVTVTTGRSGSTIEIQVSDTGTGIPADRLAAIFDDFVTTKRRGLGLGLATSRRIVEQLGGTIGVTSEVDRGTTFTIRLPETEAPAFEAVG